MITVNFDCLALTPNCRVLDIGCGSGRHVAAAYEWQNVSVVGADRNHADLAQAADRLRLHDRLGAHQGGTWNLAAADITALPFNNSAFDLIICSEVLEHIAKEQLAVDELVRVLKPGQNLVVSVPRRWPETLCWALSRHYRNTSGGHLRIYNQRGLLRMFQSRNLTHWRTHYAHSLHTPYWWLKCLVGLDKEESPPVKLYRRLLNWDILTRPRLTQCLDQLLNPLIGKSVVLYFCKNRLA
jgi:ubiquinone/menaquinone biosynthesis C-methylase UbiE